MKSSLLQKPAPGRCRKLTSVDVTHRAAFACISGPPDREQIALCRLRDGGSASICGHSFRRSRSVMSLTRR